MTILRYGILILASGLTGCISLAPMAEPAQLTNPLIIQNAPQDFVWEQVVDVVHYYHFEIARENRLDGIIETEYRVGSNILEVWHPDSVGLENRWESTLQSIRRKVVIRVTPAQGGSMVIVEVFKELEDLPGIVANYSGGATFREGNPLQRDLNLVVGQSSPSGWIPIGRDRDLEQVMLQDIHRALMGQR